MRRWSTVAAGVAVLCALPAIAAARPVPRSRLDAEALRRLVLASAARPFQGYAQSRGRIGLPGLPQLADVATLLGGTSNVRVWYASARSWRVAVVEPTGERDVYQTPNATYIWDFAGNLLTAVRGDPPVRVPWASDVVPPELARRLLRAAGPGDRITALGSRRVAGVAAAGLRLTPANPDTTVGRIDIWADPSTGLPVQVDVTARGGAEPVFSSRFLDLAQRAPDAAVVTPSRAESSGFGWTSQADLASALNAQARFELPPTLAGAARVDSPADVYGVAAYGEGLSRFVVAPLPGRIGTQSFNAFQDAGGLAVDLPGAQGYVIRSAVLTTLIVRANGRRGRTFLLAGLVTPEVLTRAAPELLASAL
jgi:hypothetical protein